MLIVLAFLLLFLLPTPWNLVGFLVVIPLWILELLAWNRSMKNRRKAVGAETLIGREAVVMTACRLAVRCGSAGRSGRLAALRGRWKETQCASSTGTI